MRMLEDKELLAAHANEGSETAFATLVERHISLVYSSALRQTRNPHLAEEITQAVFILLARKAGKLSRDTVLAGWLCRTAHYAARNALKAELRRQQHETEAHMESLLHEPEPDAWPEIAPLLDAAVAQLSEADRNAIVLRYYQQKPLDEVGRALGLNADAAQKRVARALEKLRKFFTRRGVALSAAAIAGAVSANSVQAAPVGLAAKVSVIAAKGAATTTSITTLVKGTLKIMAWTKIKTVAVAGVSVILMAGAAEVSVSHFKANDSWRNGNNFTSGWRIQDVFDKTPPQVTILPTKNSNIYGHWWPGKADQRIGLGASFRDILRDIYGVPNTRMVFSGPEPEGRYDVIANLPEGSKLALQKKIEKQFGMVPHKAVIETEVWVLKASHPDKLRASVSVSKSPQPENHTEYQYDPETKKMVETLKDESADALVDEMERVFFKAPVFNRTGLSGGYDLTLSWYYQDWEHKVKMPDTIQAIIDQLQESGFQLSSTREKTEMLIVEKVK